MGALSTAVRGVSSLVVSRTGKRIAVLLGSVVIMFFLMQLAFPEITPNVTVPVPFVSIHYGEEAEAASSYSSWSSLLSDDDSSADGSYSAAAHGGSGSSSLSSPDSHLHHHHTNKHKVNQYLSVTRFNESKVALLIENRPMAFLAPLMLHFMSVIPPDWRFRFMGSRESVDLVQKSFAIRQQVNLGKLDLTYIPSNMTTIGGEAISQFLTTLWVYETLLQPAEWLLIFQTDSMLCANSRQNLDDFLDYDWVGAPWNPNGGYGGNGGLSLRRVSSIIQVLRDQVRKPGTEPEDVWLTDRLGHRPGAKMANGSLSLTFSGEYNVGHSEMLFEDEMKAKAAAAAAGKTPAPNGQGTELDNFAVTKENLDLNEAGSGLVHDAVSKNANANAGGSGSEEGRLDLTNGAWKQGIDDYRIGHYEPMGYHIGSSGSVLHGSIWGSPEKRKHIWEYCPEVKMMLQMDAAEYVPGQCGSNWKRDDGGYGMVRTSDLGYGTEWIDGKEYPMLPPGFTAW
ncbi:uncharacterized protein B0I36DRAFT_403285 [Microdochium trichocladiopsis]|uniref:DUF5672 domain-containing protein n=1 Tax=Microdochium trichocladiopsis TaxID=1682393 RepID=A0A9P9BUS9_9PEZI|nr:uncharacterized protein B0I36DRAFT_403285 [Microdochium trichocladiopsis]KAH7037784.1 hypothetical protein B0I36DRAFT_403285 [Microdochium trichocladiopsis]